MPIIQLVSSFADDTIINLNDGTKKKSKGGPAHWITSVFKKQKINFKLLASKKRAKIRIKIIGDHEEGKILSCPQIPTLKTIEDLPTLISTIKDEFDLTNILKINNTIALDIQGYIRKLSKGSKFILPREIYTRINILKGTEDELMLVDPIFLEDQKNRTLIVTKGSLGFKLYHKGKCIQLQTDRLSPIDTIGAGDILLASFFCEFIRKKNIWTAAIFAQAEVKNFLTRKIIKKSHLGAKKILIVTDVHGNEPIGSILVKQLSQTPKINDKFDWIIANPLAVLKNKRYVRHDLNRIFPGDQNSSDYELKRASYLNKLIKRYEYVIDIHQTRANSRVLAILPKITIQTINMAMISNIENILLWPPPRNTMGGSLIQNSPCGIGFEIGTKAGYKQAMTQSFPLLLDLIKKLDAGTNFSISERTKVKSFFYVYSKIQPRDVIGMKLKDFTLIKKGKEKFVTLLFGRHQKIMGYKLQPIDYEWIKVYLSKQNQEQSTKDQ